MDDPTQAIKKARALADPLKRAKALGELLGADGLPALTKQLQQERRAAVNEAHEGLDMSFAEIGEAIGQHRARVAQIAHGISGGKRKAILAKVDAALEHPETFVEQSRPKRSES